MKVQAEEKSGECFNTVNCMIAQEKYAYIRSQLQLPLRGQRIFLPPKKYCISHLQLRNRIQNLWCKEVFGLGILSLHPIWPALLCTAFNLVNHMFMESFEKAMNVLALK